VEVGAFEFDSLCWGELVCTSYDAATRALYLTPYHARFNRSFCACHGILALVWF
jgi:hypothetical protein